MTIPRAFFVSLRVITLKNVVKYDAHESADRENKYSPASSINSIILIHGLLKTTKHNRKQSNYVKMLLITTKRRGAEQNGHS